MALSWGMPYELYWRGPLSALFVYAEKARLDREEENHVAWLHGAYITRAITSAFDGKKNPYPQKSIVQLTPEQEEKRRTLEDQIAEHNAKMREIQERSAAEFQQKIISQMAEAKSHVGTDD